MAENAFDVLFPLDVGAHIEKKEGLSYLSWSYAWPEVKKRFPKAKYSIWKNEQGLPYVFDPHTGYMVYTSVTIEGVTHEMWLPVMDGKNKAMKAEPYQYKTKSYGKEVVKTVAACTMFDINKTIMRCLVKNLAMFGLGLYIYAGEDLPISDEQEVPAEVKAATPVEEAQLKAKVFSYFNRHNMSAESLAKICDLYGIESIHKMTLQQCQHYIKSLESKGGNIDE